MRPTPEASLLVAAARARYGTATPGDVVAAAAKVPDWEAALNLARQHAVTPLLARALTGAPAGTMPAEVAEELARRAEATAVRNLGATRELLRILGLFEAAGIAALPYKGPVLAAQVYGDLALREFVDLDVLVRAPDTRRAIALLARDGYAPPHPYTARQDAHDLATGHDRKLVRGRSVVEVQWALADRTHAFTRRAEPLLARATRTTLGGRQVPTLAPEDLILVLAVHGSLHFWERLSWTCDLAETLTRGPAADLALVRRRALDAGCDRMLQLGLEVVRRLLGVDPPPALVASGKNATAAFDVARRLERRILTTPAGEGPEPEGAPQLLLRLRLRDRPRARVAEALRVVFTPSESDRLTVRLPDVLWPLYYPIRLVRLSWWYVVGRRKPGEGVAGG